MFVYVWNDMPKSSFNRCH